MGNVRRNPRLSLCCYSTLRFQVASFGEGRPEVGGGTRVPAVIRKLEGRNSVGVEDKSTKRSLLFTSIMSMPDECKTTLHQ